MARAPELTAEEFVEILRSANRYEWCLRNPESAGLLFAKLQARQLTGWTAEHLNREIDAELVRE